MINCAYAQNPPTVYPSTNNSNGMSPAETLEIAGKLKIMNVSGAQDSLDKMLVRGPGGEIRERPIPEIPIAISTPSVGWQPNGNTIVWTDRKVGIGTNTPNESLEVVGDIRANGATFDSLHINDSIKVGQSIWVGGVAPGSSTNNHIYSDNSDLYIQSFAFASFNTIINENSKAVGIGTSTPQKKLHVFTANLPPGNPGVFSDPGIRLQHFYNPTPSAFFIDSKWDLIPFIHGLIPSFSIGIPGTPFMTFLSTNTGQKVKVGALTIDAGPHVDYLMSVDGKFVARKLVATDANWADDEFKRKLTLQDLRDEESYVKERSHLMGVPSGDIIEEDGIDLAEMSVLQMRKIEQIYMYLFEMNKEITELKTENEQLREEIIQLEKYTK